MNRQKFLTLLVLPLILAAGCTTQSLLNVVDRPIAVQVDGSNWSVEQVQAAIINACRNRGWIPRMESESQVNCSIDVRGRHSANVEIPFSAERFSIIHASSQGLNYNSSRQTIHRNFNRWIANLALEIQRELGRQ